MKFWLSLVLMIDGIFFQHLHAQDSLKHEKKIRGLDYEVLPSFAYNPDRGLLYGAVVSMYNYGDSTRYPDYIYNINLIVNRTTHKEYTYRFFFDTKRLFSKKIRLTTDWSFRRNRFEQFYGFNGYNSDYQQNYEDPSKKAFISRYYYNLHKTTYTVLLDVQDELPLRHFRYDLGIGYYNIKIQPSVINETTANPLTLFEKYIDNKVILPGQEKGGITTYLKTGLIFDTRDNESVPTKGIWIEAIYCNAPSFLRNSQAYSQATFIYRQYFTLLPPLVFAYRLVYQTLLTGQMPFYMLPYLLSTYWTDAALGGVKTIRGVHNQRLEGNGYTLANFEFRYFLLNTVVLKKNVGIALNAFTDMGIVSNPYKINPALNNAAFDYRPDHERMHYGVGAGIRLILDHNFILSFDGGQPLNKQDGKTAFYIDLDYLF